MSLALLATIDKDKYTLYAYRQIKKYQLKLILIPFVFIISWHVNIHIDTIEEGFMKWKKALNIYNNGAYNDSVYEFEKEYFQFKTNGDFLMNYGKALSMSEKHNKAINILNQAKVHLNNTVIEIALGDSYKALKMYDLSENSYKMAASMIPNRFYPKYLLLKLYQETGQLEKANTTGKSILNKKIKIKSSAIDQIKKETRQIIENISEQ
jgi:tetratricopeptide (TPR) repeat protein